MSMAIAKSLQTRQFLNNNFLALQVSAKRATASASVWPDLVSLASDSIGHHALSCDSVSASKNQQKEIAEKSI
jgi:hypothetical protein